MSFFSRFLGWAQSFRFSKLKEYFGEETATKFQWLDNVFSPISIVLWIVLGLVCAAGAIYAIYVGVQLARAEEQAKREEAKKHLITVFVAVAVTVVLIVFFNELLPLILEQVILPDVKPGAAVSTVAQCFKTLVH